MAQRNTPSSQDIARLLATEPASRDSKIEATAQNLLLYWSEDPRWGYGPFFNACVDIIGKCRSEAEAMATCEKRGPGRGIPHNTVAAKLLFSAYGGGKFRAYPLSARRLELRKSPKLEAVVRPGCLIVKEDVPTVVVPQPRKNFKMSPHQWGFFAWLIHRGIATSEAAGFPIEFVDLSTDDEGEREVKIFKDSDVSQIGLADGMAHLDIFIAAYDRAVKRAPKERKERRTIIAPSTPLFGDFRT